jgi:hypothetical protein
MSKDSNMYFISRIHGLVRSFNWKALTCVLPHGTKTIAPEYDCPSKPGIAGLKDSYVAQVDIIDIILTILLPQPPECWDYSARDG